MEKFGAEEAKSTCALLSQRISRMNKHIRYRKVIEPIKRGDWVIAAKQAAGDIGIIRYVANIFVKFVSRKVQMKFAVAIRHCVPVKHP